MQQLRRAAWMVAVFLLIAELVGCTRGGDTTARHTVPAQVSTSSAQTPSFCPVTPFVTGRPPDANTAAFTTTWFGNDALWAGLAPPYGGKWYASSLKVLWWRSVPGKLTIEGKRLDGSAPPLAASIPDGYGLSGYQATGIDFPTTGCWEVTGKVASRELRFVVSVNPEGCLPANLRVSGRTPEPCSAPPA